MLDFVMAPAEVTVGQVQVLGHIPVRTDHRMVVADIRVQGTFSEAPLGVQPRPALTRHQQITPEQWQPRPFGRVRRVPGRPAQSAVVPEVRPVGPHSHSDRSGHHESVVIPGGGVSGFA